MPRVVTNSENVFLEICIPTYNRRKQLERLLTILENEIGATSIDTTIRITVSDNCSPDDTQMMLQSHSFRDKLVVRTNSENIGALRNIWGLYETVRATYVWLLSDDDILKPGSLQKILDTLVRYNPTVLTFEFEQPPGAAPKRHGEKIGIEELVDLSEAIPHVLVLGKLTKQVINARQLQDALRNVYLSRDTGYGWLLVILEVLKLAPSPKIVIDHDFLASCDEDYLQITEGLIPQFWDDYLLLLDHQIVQENCHEYAQKYKYAHYGYMVKIIYVVMAGVAKCTDYQIFQQAGKKLPFHISYFRNPFVFLQWISLRLLLPAYPSICRMSAYPGKIKRGLFTSIGELMMIVKRCTKLFQ